MINLLVSVGKLSRGPIGIYTYSNKSKYNNPFTRDLLQTTGASIRLSSNKIKVGVKNYFIRSTLEKMLKSKTSKKSNK
jgi:hypothetical protein